MDLQERGEKRKCLHRKVLGRFRAEYKIRKTRRWVQRAATFEPKQVLGWLKAVRACLNLKFVREPARRYGEFEAHVPCSYATGLSASRRTPRERDKDPLDPPFPYWWAWWREMEDSSVAICWVSTLDDESGEGSTVLPIPSPRALSGVPKMDWLGRPQDRVSQMLAAGWVKPEALGGPHLVTEKFWPYGRDEPSSLRKKRFTWDLTEATATQLTYTQFLPTVFDNTLQVPVHPGTGLPRQSEVNWEDVEDGTAFLTMDWSGPEHISRLNW